MVDHVILTCFKASIALSILQLITCEPRQNEASYGQWVEKTVSDGDTAYAPMQKPQGKGLRHLDTLPPPPQDPHSLAQIHYLMEQLKQKKPQKWDQIKHHFHWPAFQMPQAMTNLWSNYGASLWNNYGASAWNKYGWGQQTPQRHPAPTHPVGLAQASSLSYPNDNVLHRAALLNSAARRFGQLPSAAHSIPITYVQPEQPQVTVDQQYIPVGQIDPQFVQQSVVQVPNPPVPNNEISPQEPAVQPPVQPVEAMSQPETISQTPVTAPLQPLGNTVPAPPVYAAPQQDYTAPAPPLNTSPQQDYEVPVPPVNAALPQDYAVPAPSVYAAPPQDYAVPVPPVNAALPQDYAVPVPPVNAALPQDYAVPAPSVYAAPPQDYAVPVPPVNAALPQDYAVPAPPVYAAPPQDYTALAQPAYAPSPQAFSPFTPSYGTSPTTYNPSSFPFGKFQSSLDGFGSPTGSYGQGSTTNDYNGFPKFDYQSFQRDQKHTQDYLAFLQALLDEPE